jgi:tRNA-dihydrouridine synthase B
VNAHLTGGFQIGHVSVGGRLVLSPMAGVTDSAFRRICREMGAAIVFTELISADGLIRANRRTLEYLTFHESERPIGVQLFGADADTIRRALDVVEAARPDIVDLNCGCPVPKVVKRGAGSALMNDPPRLRAIVSALARGSRCPITVKIRSGWDAEHVNAPEIARMLEDAGAACVAVHGRTRSVGHSGKADWSIIGEVKRAVTIPVIGNGGVYEPPDARRMLEETGCDAVMVARGALGNPWTFARMNAVLAGEAPPSPPDVEERSRVLQRHFAYLREIRPDQVAVREIRKHVGWYLTGLPYAGRVRQQVNSLTDAEAMDALFVSLPDILTQRPYDRDAHRSSDDAFEPVWSMLSEEST